MIRSPFIREVFRGFFETTLTTPRFDEICAKITPFLKALGFNPKTDLTFIPVSAQVGENMKDRVDKKIAPWYE